jgi:arylsulfatase
VHRAPPIRACTQAGILTGQSPWNHGMLGYGAVAPVYPFEMPVALRAVGYTTASIGKDHFGWNASRTLPPLLPKYDTGDKGSGTPHGYEGMSLYDGLVGQEDEYHQWFEREMPGHTAEEGWPTLNMNGWMGAPFVFAEYLHPTAWVGQQAVDWLTSKAKAEDPWFLKVSFHRPHSPYDPPARVLNATKIEDLPPVQLAKDGWDTVFRGGEGDPSGCGASDLSAWCGLMPQEAQDLGRRSYYANVAFIDEWVGKIMAALTETEQLESTYILWSADHGDGQEDHYHWRKGFPYEFSSHVPLLFRWPEKYQSSTIMKRGHVETELVTELRDVFPTMLDAAGAMSTVPKGHQIDGMSLLCLLKDPSGKSCTDCTSATGCSADGKGWRQWVDLEHTTCYNNTNHWSALTDGKMKYIFNACLGCSFPAKEQLFNLTADPGENDGLHAMPAYAAELAKWRGRMVAQFTKEGRGPVWVKGGELQLRPTQTYGPNFPGHVPHHGGHMYTCENVTLKSGDRIDLEPNQQTSNIKYCQDIGTNMPRMMPMIVAPTLCIAVASDGSSLELDACVNTSAAQQWKLPLVDDKRGALPAVHIESGKCITAQANGAVGLAECNPDGYNEYEPEALQQKWVLGASGRLCADSGCLSVRAGSAAAGQMRVTRRSFL